MIADVPEEFRAPGAPRFQIINPFPELSDPAFKLPVAEFLQQAREGTLKKGESNYPSVGTTVPNSRGSPWNSGISVPNSLSPWISGNSERALHSDSSRYPLFQGRNPSPVFAPKKPMFPSPQDHGAPGFIPPFHNTLAQNEPFLPTHPSSAQPTGFPPTYSGQQQNSFFGHPQLQPGENYMPSEQQFDYENGMHRQNQWRQTNYRHMGSRDQERNYRPPKKMRGGRKTYRRQR